MTVRSRCPAGLLRRPVHSVKLQGTSFPKGARSPVDGAHGLGGRIPLSREQRRSGASPLGWAPCSSYSERNRSHTVLRVADRRHPVGGPAARAALFSPPVGPSPSKSREPWLVLSLPDRLNRTRPAAWARPMGLPLISPTAGPRFARTTRTTRTTETSPEAATDRTTEATTETTRETSTAASAVRMAVWATARAAVRPGLPSSPTSSPEPTRRGRRSGESQGSPERAARARRASRAFCAALPAGAALRAVTTQGPAGGVTSPRATPRGLR